MDDPLRTPGPGGRAAAAVAEAIRLSSGLVWRVSCKTQLGRMGFWNVCWEFAGKRVDLCGGLCGHCWWEQSRGSFKASES